MSDPAERRERTVDVLSILSPDEIAVLGGLPREGVVGIYVDDARRLEGFRANPRFLSFLHRVIRTAGPADPDLLATAAVQGTGWAYLIDGRTPDGPQGRVPLDDVIGHFKVEKGRLVEGSYKPNENYEALTASGVVRLSPSLRQEFFPLLKEMVKAQDARIS